MKMIRFLILMLCVLGSKWGMGQILFSGLDEVARTDYNGMPFYAIKNTQNDPLPFGNVQFIPDGSAGWRFTWSYEGNMQPVIYEDDSTSLTVNLLGNGVYSFRAEKEGINPIGANFTIFYVSMPLQLSIENEMDCHYITLKVDGVENPPAYNGYIGAENPLYTVVWGGKERTLAEDPNYYRQISQFVEGEYKDVQCRVKIKDRFGLNWESNETTYHSYIPLAEFSANPMQGEAPLEVTFDNRSENAQSFEWYLYKDTTEIQPGMIAVEDSLLDGKILTEKILPPYIYEHPGSYNVKLVVINTRGINQCSDTVYIERYILVDSSLVDVPNVFTPNGDGINDVFRVKAQSLEYFHGVIINRWGRKVHEWDDPLEGWNGKINGKYASPGTYYYIITARGREIKTKKYVKKGPLLLVR